MNRRATSPTLHFDNAGNATNAAAAGLPRHQQRMMKRAAAEAKRITGADRRFFERFPHRIYRMRRAGRAEIAQLEALMGGVIFTAEGEAPFVMVKCLAPGVRLRTLVPGPADEDGSDAPEAGLAILWQRLTERQPAIAQREAAMLQAMRLPGGPLHGGGAA